MLDSDGGEIVLVDSKAIVPHGRSTFGQISQAALEKNAVALGILNKNDVLK